MKKYLLLTILVGLCISGFSQGLSSYGHSPYLKAQPTYKKGYPFATFLAGLDTLTTTGTPDTNYIQFTLGNCYNRVFDLSVVSLTGTLAGNAVLMGSTSQPMPTYPNDPSWKVLTGKVTVCAGCVAASATLTGSGTTTYQWHVDNNGDDYNSYQIRSIITGTCTATNTGGMGYKN